MTLEELDAALAQARADMARSRKIYGMVDALQDERRALYTQLQDKKAALEKEELDVDKLERGGLTRMLHQLMGTLEEKSETERREAVAARVAYESCLRQVEDIDRRLGQLDAEYKALADADARYAQASAQKQAALAERSPELGAELDRLTAARDAAAVQLRELNEAIEAGQAARVRIDRMAGHLSKAGNWGVYDMLGGGLIADLAKHQHLDQVQDEATCLQAALRAFRTELCDVAVTEEFQLNVGDFARTADFLFDGIFADSYMQTKIHSAEDSLARVRAQVSGVLSALDDRRAAEEAKKKQAQDRLQTLIERGF